MWLVYWVGPFCSPKGPWSYLVPKLVILREFLLGLDYIVYTYMDPLDRLLGLGGGEQLLAAEALQFFVRHASQDVWHQKSRYPKLRV